jgi:uncharacterized protein YbjT (DUF2867 family)
MILVVGSTGQLGGLITRRLLARISHGRFLIGLKAQKVKAHDRKTVFRPPSVTIKPLDCVMTTGGLISEQSASCW